MIRLWIFIFGAVLFLLGAATNFQWFQLPFDLRSIVISVGFVSFTLDVVLLVAGVFFIFVAWLFTRLAH